MWYNHNVHVLSGKGLSSCLWSTWIQSCNRTMKCNNRKSEQNRSDYETTKPSVSLLLLPRNCFKCLLKARLEFKETILSDKVFHNGTKPTKTEGCKCCSQLGHVFISLRQGEVCMEHWVSGQWATSPNTLAQAKLLIWPPSKQCWPPKEVLAEPHHPWTSHLWLTLLKFWTLSSFKMLYSRCGSCRSLEWAAPRVCMDMTNIC